MKLNKKTLILAIVIVAAVTTVIVAVVCNGRHNSLHNEPQNTEDYQVDFWIDNSLYDVQFVKPGKSAYPKVVELLPGKVFIGWDAPLDNIQGNTTAKAMFEETLDKTNCFALESTYCAVSESTTMNLILCGDINLSSADFKIKYNADMMHLDEIKSIDPSIVANSDTEKGIVYCSMLLEEPVDGDIDCMQLVFSVVDDATKSNVSIDVEDASAFRNNKIVDAKTDSIPGTVYVLPKR